MKKFTFKTLLAAAALCVGSVNAWAESLNATVKMTYVDYDKADTSYGEIAAGETARTGYNNISGGSVEFKTLGWNVNYITYLQVDASALPSGATITAATLSFQQSGSTDSKRTTTVGAGYNSSTWSNTMTYNTADKSITTLGGLVGTSTKSASVFEDKEINITSAFTGDADNVVTILLYETEAAGCYIKNPAVTVTYTLATPHNVTFTETNSVAATVKIGDTDVTSGTILVDGDYSFTATADGYETYNGNFTVSGADKNVEFAMTAKTPITSITVNYTYNDEVVFSEAQPSVAGLYVGDSYNIPFRMYVMKDGTLYQSTQRGSSPYYGEPTTLIANNVVEKAVTPVDLGGGTVVLFEDLDMTTAQNANYRASYCSAYDNTAYTSSEDLPAGVYTLICRVQSQNRGSKIKIGDIEFDVLAGLGKGSWSNVTISDVNVPTAGKLTIAAGGSKTRDDYDVIIAVLKSVPATIGATGYATFASSAALDLSKLPDGLTAYYVSSVSGEYATLAEANTAVPAGEGLLLKGTAGATYNIPVAAEGTALDGNMLVGLTETTTITEGNYVFGAIQSGEEYTEVGFHKVAAGGYELAAGKAYLKTTGSSAKLRFVFEGDDATAIKAIATEAAQDGAIYNVAGQRVNAAYKGIIIKNGKKYINK
ncbi:MAG: hypothetical protein IJV06_01040 [Bacteroidaceae bacterium]|nr:hypothetical protein [Bacteroidaceae bacterium]